jgi:hypothetical protein
MKLTDKQTYALLHKVYSCHIARHGTFTKTAAKLRTLIERVGKRLDESKKSYQEVA